MSTIEVQEIFGIGKTRFFTLWKEHSCTHFRNSYIGTKLMICEKQFALYTLATPLFSLVLEWLKRS